MQIIACRIRHPPRHRKYTAPAGEIHFYLLTGPPGPKPLSAWRLAALARGYWGIESRLHHVKDPTFREDDQEVRCWAMALGWLRTATLTLLESWEKKSQGKASRCIPEIRSHCSAHPHKAGSHMRAG